MTAATPARPSSWACCAVSSPPPSRSTTTASSTGSRGAYSYVRPAAADAIPLYFGGASPAALSVGAQHADVYMLWGEPVAQIAGRVAGIRAEAARHGRTVRFSLSVRPIVASTEEAAWQRAEQIRAATEERVRGTQARGSQVQSSQVQGSQVQGIQVPDTPGPARRMFGFRESSSVGSDRLQRQAAEREVYDDRLWYGVTRLTGPGGNSTALVGTRSRSPEH